jgi:glycosyltransferase involved in cell wall biosynthesis
MGRHFESRGRPQVVFVGGFSDRHVRGGQVFASRSLVASPLRGFVRWILIDSTMAEAPPPPIWVRLGMALGRVALLARALATRPQLVILFVSAGPSFLEKTFMALCARLVGVPVLFCPRSGFVVDMAERSLLGRILIRIAARISTAFVCQAQTWAAFYRDIEPSCRTFVIPNFIDEAPYLSIAARPPDADPMFLFLGSIEINKGVYDLVAAAELLVADGRKFSILMGGSGGEVERLRARLSSSPARESVHLLGLVGMPLKMDLLARCSAVVLPSYREGFPNVVLEAMAAARPVAVTRAGALPELVEHGRNGLVSDCGDPQGLAQSLAYLMDEPAAATQMGLDGRSRISRRYSLHDQWRHWHEAINSLLDE